MRNHTGKNRQRLKLISSRSMTHRQTDRQTKFTLSALGRGSLTLAPTRTMQSMIWGERSEKSNTRLRAGTQEGQSPVMSKYWGAEPPCYH